MESNAYVYKHIRLDTNQVFYVGIGSKRRPTDYQRANRTSRRNKFWTAIVNKCGHRVEIVLDNISWDVAQAKERELIATYGRRNIKTGSLVNLTDGGEGCVGMILTEEHKSKIGAANKGIPRTAEQKEINRLAHIGKKTSEETKQKLRLSASGRRHSEESIALMRRVQTGKKYSNESKAKMSIAKIGKRQSAETVAKKSKPVIDVKTGVRYGSVTEAAAAFGLDKKNLSNMLTGWLKNKTSLTYAG